MCTGRLTETRPFRNNRPRPHSSRARDAPPSPGGGSTVQSMHSSFLPSPTEAVLLLLRRQRGASNFGEPVKLLTEWYSRAAPTAARWVARHRRQRAWLRRHSRATAQLERRAAPRATMPATPPRATPSRALASSRTARARTCRSCRSTIAIEHRAKIRPIGPPCTSPPSSTPPPARAATHSTSGASARSHRSAGARLTRRR